MNGEDIEIIKKCLHGNIHAFEELVNRYKKLIFNTSYRMLGNYEEAEDAAQEVFIKIYRSLNRYDPCYKFSTWSVKITTNYCLDILRKRKAEIYPLDEQYDLKDEGLSPEEHYISLEKQQIVQRAIDELPDKYKELIILFHHRGLSYSEIMDVTGESLTIVKNRLYRGRQMLKEIIERYDKESETICNAVKYQA